MKGRMMALAERLFGVHVVPDHFYSPVPSVRDVDPAASTRLNPCVGLDIDAGLHLEALRELFPSYVAEYQPAANIGLSRVDSLVLYAMIRSRRPRKFMEIGAGESTRITLAAVERNAAEGFPCEVTSIDPHPPDHLRGVAAPGFRLLATRVQEVAEREFQSADILFIDSSHVSKMGSDVNYEILNIVPRLKTGALVHWHDIMIPVDYPMAWIRKRMYFNESYVVHAFLLFNAAFRIRWAARYMQVTHPDELRRVFPYFDPSDPDQQLSSLWVERVA